MKKIHMASLAVLFAAIAGGYIAGRARADGIPTLSPMYYGGYLEDGLRPVDGMRDITLRLWDAAMGGTLSCAETTASTMVQSGRWRIAVDAGCVMAVQRTNNLWTEIVVNGTSFGRSKIGAVPFAVEAGRAAAASGGLETRIAAVEGRARARQVVVTNGTSLGFTATNTATYRVTAGGTFRPGMQVGGTAYCGMTFSVGVLSGTAATLGGSSLQHTASTGGYYYDVSGVIVVYYRLTAGMTYSFGVTATVTSGSMTCVAMPTANFFSAEETG